MTLEQATQRAITAAAASDLKRLKLALKARAAAITGLAAEPPSEDLAARLRSAIEGGKALQQDLGALKRKIRFESARLAQFRTAFVTGLGSAPVRRIDYRG